MGFLVYFQCFASFEQEEWRKVDIRYYEFPTFQQQFLSCLYQKRFSHFLNIFFSLRATCFPLLFCGEKYTFCDVIYFLTSKKATWIKMSKNDLFPIIYISCTIFFLLHSKWKKTKRCLSIVRFFMCILCILYCVTHFPPCRRCKWWWNRCQKNWISTISAQIRFDIYKKWHQHCWMIYRNRMSISMYSSLAHCIAL